jgi:PAS domain S-box-containing protein
VVTWGLLSLGFGVLLLPFFPLSLRESASGLGLLVGGSAATVSLALRARRSEGDQRRPWLLLAAAGLIAILGNVWVTITGADPVSSPSLLGDATIAIALILSILGLLAFPVGRRRGAELGGMLLDGLVAGGALLLIASVLVYSELLDSSGRDGTTVGVLALVFPVLDVVLATVAILLVVRATRADRLVFALIAAGFLLYAASDMAFAVRTAQDDFHFGTLIDLGWIVGYLTLALAAWLPWESQGAEAEDTGGLADAFGTTLVFAVLIVAAAVQVLFGRGSDLRVAHSVLWVVLVAAAGLRQILLTTDNSALRRSLERQVLEQTADLRRLARQHEVLITSVGDGVYGVDQKGQVTFVNPSAAAALGYTADELKGRLAHDVFHAPQPDGLPFPWHGCYIHDAITQGNLTQAEEDEYVRADGSVFPVEITASPLVDESEIRGAVVVFRDVTQRREVDRMKNEFLAVVSHELRTPLTSIRGSLGLLAGGRLGELPERAASLVAVAVQNSERLTRLINDLLDMERIQSGTAPMTIAPLDVRELLDLAAAQIAGMASSVGIGIEIVSAEGSVLADEDRTIQTLMNLLGNAIKFSEPGSTVRLAAAPEGNMVHFRVSDDGRGIPADKLESIFERFEQVDSSDTRQKGGTGLGLTISRGIVEGQGGRIWIESELGVGTTAHVMLPVAPHPVAGTPAAESEEQGAGGGPSVLVCDDDPETVEEFSRLLRQHGYRPLGVTAGADVLELVRREQPHAVLLDLKMPGMSGAQVLAQLRGSAATSRIPVVVVSGLGPEADEEAARTSEGWLIKPVSEQRMFQALSIAMSGREPRASVLLVEDDEGIAEVMATLLAQEGLDVVRASAATEAVVRGSEMRPDVIILDMLLPDGNGRDVVAEFRRRGTLAQASLVIYSAAEIEVADRDELRLGDTVFLTKGRVSPETVRDQVLALVGVLENGEDKSPTGRKEPDGASPVRPASTNPI